MNFWRRSAAGVTLMDRKKNENIREIIQEEESINDTH